MNASFLTQFHFIHYQNNKDENNLELLIKIIDLQVIYFKLM